jgi:AcrR family transcriptional regulator
VTEPASGAPRRPRVRTEDIVSTAAALFARDGYHQVGMRTVADALGIRGASLYHHYASKEEILYAIALTVTQEPVEQQLPLLDAPGTPRERLAALVAGHVRHLSRRRVEHLVGLHELSALTPEHRAEVDAHRRYYQRRVREVIAAGVAAGELHVDDVHVAALALLDMLNGISRWYSPDGPLSVDDLTERYVALADALLRAGLTPPRR